MRATAGGAGRGRRRADRATCSPPRTRATFEPALCSAAGSSRRIRSFAGSRPWAPAGSATCARLALLVPLLARSRFHRPRLRGVRPRPSRRHGGGAPADRPADRVAGPRCDHRRRGRHRPRQDRRPRVREASSRGVLGGKATLSQDDREPAVREIVLQSWRLGRGRSGAESSPVHGRHRSRRALAGGVRPRPPPRPGSGRTNAASPCAIRRPTSASLAARDDDALLRRGGAARALDGRRSPRAPRGRPERPGADQRAPALGSYRDTTLAGRIVPAARRPAAQCRR